MDWTDKIIQTFIKHLESSQTVGEALEKSSLETSTSALRSAFRRHGYKAPSHYLGSANEAGAEPEHKPSERSYGIEFQKEQYTLKYAGQTFKMSFEDVDTLVLMYSDTGPGLGKTAEECAMHLYNKRGHKWATPEVVAWFLGAIGQTKKRFPQAAHQLGQTYQDVYDQMRFKKEALLASINDGRSNAELLKEIDGLQDKLAEVSQIVGTADSLVDKPVGEVEFERLAEDDSTLVVCWADLHSGKLVEKHPLTNMDNEYNAQVFEDRIALVLSIIERESRYLKGSVERIVLAGLGDLFEALGSNMRSDQHLGMYGTALSNWEAVLRANVNLIKQLVKSFEVPVECIYIPANHDRMLPNREEHTNNIIMQIFVERLAREFVDENLVNIQVGQPVTSLMLPNKTNLILSHGHLKKVPSSESGWSKFVRVHSKPGAKRVATLQAHFHCAQLKWMTDGLFVQVPAICGSDDYAENVIHKSNPAAFLMIMSDEHGERPIGPFSLQRGSDEF